MSAGIRSGEPRLRGDAVQESASTSNGTLGALPLKSRPDFEFSSSAARCLWSIPLCPPHRTLGVAGRCGGVLPQKGDRHWPRPLGRPQVGPALRVLRAQEAVPGAFEYMRLVDLAEVLHLRLGRRYRRVDPGVAAAVETQDGAFTAASVERSSGAVP